MRLLRATSRHSRPFLYMISLLADPQAVCSLASGACRAVSPTALLGRSNVRDIAGTAQLLCTGASRPAGLVGVPPRRVTPRPASSCKNRQTIFRAQVIHKCIRYISGHEALPTGDAARGSPTPARRTGRYVPCISQCSRCSTATLPSEDGRGGRPRQDPSAAHVLRRCSPLRRSSPAPAK